jgi:signal transduction histidine kinase
LKFTEKGEIRFGYTVEAERLGFFVVDTGIGIDPSNQNNLIGNFI